MLGREEIFAKYDKFLKNNDIDFNDLAINIFRYQAKFNKVYSSFLSYLSIKAENIERIEQIPFLPVSLFKTHKIVSGNWEVEKTFESSATSSLITSKHHVYNLGFYLENAKNDFENTYGDIKDYCFMALLPSYLERNSSSLVYMVDYFIRESNCGGFYKYNYDELLNEINNYKGDKNIVLIGVSYALLEMANKHPQSLNGVIIMETGGMKGRAKELPRIELHKKLINAFNVDKIHSEYGMTELLSQSYSKGDGIFKLSPTMKILFSDIYDPFSLVEKGRQGKINIIDIANIDTCSFLATDDLGRDLGKCRFEVLGRTDESDIRGCNLLFE